MSPSSRPFAKRVLFHVAEAAIEFHVGVAHRALGVDVQLARQVDDREQDVAQLLAHVRILVHELSGLHARVGEFA